MDARQEERLAHEAARVAHGMGTIGRRVGRSGRVTGFMHRELYLEGFKDNGGQAGAEDYCGYIRRRYGGLEPTREGVGRATSGKLVRVFGARARVTSRLQRDARGNVVRDDAGRAVWERVR
jgi:hypothetical protein